MTDDDTADVLRDAIDAYFDIEETDTDDLVWVLVRALWQAEEKAARS